MPYQYGRTESRLLHVAVKRPHGLCSIIRMQNPNAVAKLTAGAPEQVVR